MHVTRRVNVLVCLSLYVSSLEQLWIGGLVARLSHSKPGSNRADTHVSDGMRKGIRHVQSFTLRECTTLKGLI